MGISGAFFDNWFKMALIIFRVISESLYYIIGSSLAVFVIGNTSHIIT